MALPEYYCRIEYTLNGETEINYVPAYDGVNEQHRLRVLGAWIHDVSYGEYSENTRKLLKTLDNADGKAHN